MSNKTLLELKKDYINDDIIKKLKQAKIKTIEVVGLDGLGNELPFYNDKYNCTTTVFGQKDYPSNRDYIDELVKSNNWIKIDDDWNEFGAKDWDVRENTYNGCFLGVDFIYQYNDDSDYAYISFHIAGDARANYTDYYKINRDELDDLLRVDIGIILIDDNGNKYTTYNQQSFDIAYFDEISINNIVFNPDELEELIN